MSFPGHEYRSPKVKTLRVRLWKDSIAVIREPRFVDVGTAAYPDDEDWVVGIEGETEAKAYPVKVLAWRHIVNDQLDGKPVVVTYSSLCRSVAVFEAGAPTGRQVFGVAGLNIAASNLVMYDDETLSLWNQLLAECLWGKLAGTTLTRIPFVLSKWREWKRLFPRTRVLSTDLGLDYDYASYPTEAMMEEFVESWEEYERSASLPNPVPSLDRRLHPKTMIIAPSFGAVVKAYPYTECRKKIAVNDTVEGRGVAIFFSPESQTPAAYLRQLDGRDLTFTERDTKICDQETGSVWNIAGAASEGSLKGKRLSPIPATHCMWFGWWATYPDSLIYEAD